MESNALIERTTPDVTIYAQTPDAKMQISKRLMDVILAGSGVILLLPVFAVIYLCIKREDPRGSVFFSQERVGKNGQLFRMYKFRSMVSDAEKMREQLLHLNEVSGAMFKIKNDPRITRVGRWLRKTSLDELPQLWNVIKGDMSLVGPRPPLPEEVKQYTPYDMQRLMAVPGCTGLWQVSGRNRVGFQEMVELDLRYISEHSLVLDVSIMFRTVKVLFGSKDAF
ncbi:sugar transferase [Paenibacillus sp. JCM 10914]|uniref:sugar transferase n=1 Tax=Paenibacillus sp. JCM 10914 TaxID=1236974 RepID=UPI0003CCA824|nr:sugar transferase [Paenibacillus sp. JCM 10914]GAE07309.1 undecaprenyl-phosphate galactosephosphotransferase [Paenibacillus sp. JCM 10914]